MKYKLSVLLDPDLSNPLERVVQILDCSVAQIVREALKEKLGRLRADPEFQARRTAWMQSDDGLGPTPEEESASELTPEGEKVTILTPEEQEPEDEDRSDEVNRLMASQQAAMARIGQDG